MGNEVHIQAMLNIGMSPQLVLIHIGTNLVVAKHNTSVKKSSDWKDIENTLGLKPDQVQDLMKYTGKNFDDLNYNMDDIERVLKKYTKPDVLILDGFLISEVNKKEAENLFKVLEYRNNTKSTIICSQL